MTDTLMPTARPAARPAVSSGRVPWTVHLAAVPLFLISAVTCFGAVYFGTHGDPTRPAGAPAPGSWQAWALIFVLLAYAVTALASVPGLYRRSRPAWCIALGYLGAQVLFGSLKFFGLGEDAALTFVVVDLVVAGALLSRPTRRWFELG